MTGRKERLRALARARGLHAVEELIAKFRHGDRFDRPVTNDARLGAPPHQEPLNVLGQMARCGLDPILVDNTLEWMKDRPLERGLVAWDALASTLIPEGDERLEKLRQFAAPLRDELPAPAVCGIDLNRHPSDVVVAARAGMARVSEVSLIELFSGLSDYDLASIAELHRRGDEIVGKPATLTSLHALSKVMQLAHLPTLASIYADFISRVLGHRAAAREVCETLFDAQGPERIPGDAIQPGDFPPEMLNDAAEYLTYRAHITVRATPAVSPAQILELFEQNQRNRNPSLPAPSAQLHVIHAHLSTLAGRPSVELTSLDRICDQNKTWRYAARVRILVAAATLPARSPRPLALLHDYITAFGNDFSCAYEALLIGRGDAAWKAEALPLVAREVAELPHDPAAWRTLVIMLGDRVGILRALDEIQKKIEAQSRLPQ